MAATPLRHTLYCQRGYGHFFLLLGWKIYANGQTKLSIKVVSFR